MLRSLTTNETNFRRFQNLSIMQFLPETEGMVMRTDLEPFKDARVRKAVRMAVDRQALADL